MSRSSSLLRTAFTFLTSVALASSLAACGGGAEGAAGPADPTAAAGPLIGAQAPEFQGDAISGEGPTSVKDAAGKVVIVDFWATYCAPCKESFPKYQAIIEEFAGDVAVIGVSVDDPDDATDEQLKQFAEATGVKFAVVWDKDKSIAKRYNPPKMPTSYIIDRSGVVRHIHAGYEAGEEAKIADEVKALLGN